MITPEIISKAREKERENIIRRVAAGKPITARERRLAGLDKGEVQEWAPNRAALADVLGCHPNSISRWLKEFANEPDLPTRHNGGRNDEGGWHIEKWKAFVEAHGLNIPADGHGPQDHPDDLAQASITSIKKQQELEKLKRFRRENEVAEEKLFTSAEVTTWLAEKGALLSALIHQRLALEAPAKFAGLSAQEIADRLGPIEKELINAFRMVLPKS